MVFLGYVSEDIRLRRDEHQRRQVSLGYTSECLVLPNDMYPFARVEPCAVGDTRSIQYEPYVQVQGRIHVLFIPGYVLEGHSNPEFYRDVTLGKGPFHNRSLKENILRQSMLQSHAQNRKIPTIQYSK